MSATNTNCRFAVKDLEDVKRRMLNWADRFSIFCFLDNHGYQAIHHSVECLLAAGVQSQFRSVAAQSLPDLQQYLDEKKRWLFGHMNYDLKMDSKSTVQAKRNRVDFPDIFFFEPSITIRLSEGELHIESNDISADKIYYEIMHVAEEESTSSGNVNIQQRSSRQEYIGIIEKLKKHILRGDCYEINYCIEFFAEGASIDPVAVFKKMSEASPNPFSALYKLEDKWLICASPERFLKKSGSHILSQPIKGTSSRFLKDESKDKKSKEALFNSEKDRSENVMVVDLVRNDLARVCKEGTVKVDELFGIYSFPQVHQMISTISGELKSEVSFSDIIKATFPMGSMTGAPKKRVMELVDQYEKNPRGIFSGAVGYMTPEGDFDFNVVIRSIMYNASEKYISFMAGSGITFYSDAEKEYEECILKAHAMKSALV